MHGIGGFQPLTTPARASVSVANYLTERRWVPSVDPESGTLLTVCIQESFTTRCDPIMYVLMLVLVQAENVVHDLYQRLPRLLVVCCDVLLCIVTHALVVAWSFVLLYPVNPLRWRLFPKCLYDPKHAAIAALRKVGLQHVVGAVNSDDTSLAPLGDFLCNDAGLMLMTNDAQCPADDSGFESYQDAGGIEVLIKKGIQWLFLARRRTLLINTHMQATDDPLLRVVGAANAHSRQVTQLRAFINRWQDSSKVDFIFLIGDLNTLGMSNAEVEKLFGLYKLSSDESTHPTDGCIDHVMCNVSSTGRTVATQTFATEPDHKMIVFEIS